MPGVRVLVTGGAGFIGSHLVEASLARGFEVRVLDSFATGHRENLAPFLARIDLQKGDVRSLEDCDRAVRGCEAVFHLAALPSVQRSVEDPSGSHAVNCTGTVNILESARARGVRRVVYASSSSIYGDSLQLPKREDQPPRPLSPYAASKLAGELYGRAFNTACGGRTSLNTIYAPLQRLAGKALPAVHAAARQGDVRDSQADISAAKAALGWTPRVGLEEGLRLTLAAAGAAA